jgi:hypothetical protein
MDWKDKVSGYEDAYKNAPADDFGNLPDGLYQASIEALVCGQTKDGDPMVQAKMRVSVGPSKGRMIFKNWLLTAPERVEWLAKDIRRMEVDIASLSELEEHAADFEGLTLDIKLQTKGEFQNAYIMRRVRGVSGEVEAPKGKAAPKSVPPKGDDFPF